MKSYNAVSLQIERIGHGLIVLRSIVTLFFALEIGTIITQMCIPVKMILIADWATFAHSIGRTLIGII